jgi:hypothetical protein
MREQAQAAPFFQENAMRKAAGVATIATVVLMGAAGTARAAPWCAWFTGRDYSYDCGYYTLEQCRTTVRGVGGYCAQNVYPEPPPYPPPPYRKNSKPRRHG